MNLTCLAIMEAAAVASSLSIDALAAGFAYGSAKIKVPMKSIQMINIICSLITGLSLFAGTLIAPYLPERLTIYIAFVILLAIGAIKLLDSITKTIIRKHGDFNREIKISMLNFKFILTLYADPEKADIDASKDITPTEAAALALSLSIDGIAVGFGAALANVNPMAVFLWSLLTNTAAIVLGIFLGEKISAKAPFNLSWISGAVLIILAFSKLF